jgi:hypothetical protein
MLPPIHVCHHHAEAGQKLDGSDRKEGSRPSSVHGQNRQQTGTPWSRQGQRRAWTDPPGCGRTLEYTGSKACSASMSAAVPPCRCTSAIAWSASVVLPLLSGPNTCARPARLGSQWCGRPHSKRPIVRAKWDELILLDIPGTGSKHILVSKCLLHERISIWAYFHLRTNM